MSKLKDDMIHIWIWKQKFNFFESACRLLLFIYFTSPSSIYFLFSQPPFYSISISENFYFLQLVFRLKFISVLFHYLSCELFRVTDTQRLINALCCSSRRVPHEIGKSNSQLWSKNEMISGIRVRVHEYYL